MAVSQQRFTGRTATGAAGAGIGGATARLLASVDASIVDLEHHSKRLSKTVSTLRSEQGVLVYKAHLDLRDLETPSTNPLFSESESSLGVSHPKTEDGLE